MNIWVYVRITLGFSAKIIIKTIKVFIKDFCTYKQYT